MYSYQYPHPAVTVDVAAFVKRDGHVKLLLIKRAQEPYAGKWALPGGFVDIDEDLEDAARRELKEETGLSVGDIQQLKAYGKPGRDPRERVITVAYTTMIDSLDTNVCAASDADQASWFNIDSLPDLAFDHADIIHAAIQQVCNTDT